MSVEFRGVDGDGELFVTVRDVYVSLGETVRAVEFYVGNDCEDRGAYLDAATAMGACAAIVDAVRAADSTFPILEELLQWCLVIEHAKGADTLEKAASRVNNRLAAAAVKLRQLSREAGE